MNQLQELAKRAIQNCKKYELTDAKETFEAYYQRFTNPKQTEIENAEVRVLRTELEAKPNYVLIGLIQKYQHSAKTAKRTRNPQKYHTSKKKVEQLESML